MVLVVGFARNAVAETSGAEVVETGVELAGEPAEVGVGGVAEPQHRIPQVRQRVIGLDLGQRIPQRHTGIRGITVAGGATTNSTLPVSDSTET